MGINLLRIAARIASVPVESKIRHNTHDKFNLAEFKKLSSPEECLDYANKRLKSLGRGSSRKVFALTNSKVLKIAIKLDAPGMKGNRLTGAGVDQNKNEVDIYTNPKTKPIVTEVFDFDPNYSWIISEAVRMLHSADEWSQLMGSDYYITIKAADAARESGMAAYHEVMLQAVEDNIDVDEKVVDMIIDLYNLDLAPGDIYDIDHWGKTTSGRVVLLDYGFSNEISAKHYEFID